jgi:hypothetical protein
MLTASPHVRRRYEIADCMLTARPHVRLRYEIADSVLMVNGGNPNPLFLRSLPVSRPPTYMPHDFAPALFSFGVSPPPRPSAYMPHDFRALPLSHTRGLVALPPINMRILRPSVRPKHLFACDFTATPIPAKSRDNFAVDTKLPCERPRKENSTWWNLTSEVRAVCGCERFDCIVPREGVFVRARNRPHVDATLKRKPICSV